MSANRRGGIGEGCQEVHDGGAAPACTLRLSRRGMEGGGRKWDLQIYEGVRLGCRLRWVSCRGLDMARDCWVWELGIGEEGYDVDYGLVMVG